MAVCDIDDAIALRDYQEAGLSDIRNALNKHKRVCYVLPTGGGKTVMFCRIAKLSVAKGNRVCILMHRKELIHQVVKALGDHPHGVIYGGMETDRKAPIQVATIQSMATRTRRFRFDLIIVDETHHATAGGTSDGSVGSDVSDVSGVGEGASHDE